MKPLRAAAVVLFAGLCGLSLGADRLLPERSVEGELVELSCYLSQGARGAAHRDCAAAGLRRGGAAGILLDDGQLLVVLQDPRREAVALAPLAAQRVRARGVAYSKSGVVGLVIASIGKAP